VSLPEQVGALARLREEGKVRLIGLSNVDRAQLDAALALAPIVSIQNRYNPVERGITFLPQDPLGAHPMRRGAPLAGEGRGSKEQGGTPARQALRWVVGRYPN
jgi:pyridoxine 4-dehydrogenase